MSGAKLGWKDDLFTALLSAGILAALVATTKDLGYARDEGFYFQAADAYGRWFDILFSNPKAAFDPKTVDAYWRMNSEHPGLVKSLFALSNLILQKKMHLFSMEGTSYRFPGMLFAAGAVSLVYRFGAEARGRLAGLLAAFSLLFMPRFFYHSHLDCFDVPVVTMFLLVVYTWWKSLREGGLRWAIATGITFGLALDTKHNAWFLPILALAHTGVTYGLARAREKKGEHRASADILRRAAGSLFAMATLGPLVMYTLWPWIWHDTLPRLKAYVSFHLNHEYYNMEFLGKTYYSPPMPRLYAPVMTLATVPTVTIALFLFGLCLRGRARLRAFFAKNVKKELGETDLLWLGAIGVCYGAWLLPKTPIFGGTKHWMTAYPFLALFAGAGFAWLVTALRAELRRAKRASLRPYAKGIAAPSALLSILLLGPALSTFHSTPWGLSYYVPLVGGPKGGASLGLNRTFWGYTTGAVVDYLNREVPRGGAVFIHDTAWPSWDMLQKDGRLRRDIRGVGSVHEADFALYHHEQHMQALEQQAWLAYGTVRPDHVAGIDGVPVIWVYRRKR